MSATLVLRPAVRGEDGFPVAHPEAHGEQRVVAVERRELIARPRGVLAGGQHPRGATVE